MKHDPLKKAVRRGVEKLRDLQAAREMLGSGEVDQIMKDIEGKCGTALVRGIFGEICMELKTGDNTIHICENTRIDGKELVYAPVGPEYRLILDQPVNREKTTDLHDESLYPEIWASFDGIEMMNYQEADITRMLKKLYPTRYPVMKVSGKAQFYGYFPKIKSTMNGPFKPEDDAEEYEELSVEWMVFGKMFIKVIQTDPVIDHPKLGPILYGRVFIGTEEGFRRGDGIVLVLSRPFSGDLRKDLRDMGFYLINVLCQIRKNPERFKKHLKEQNLKSLKVEQPEDDYFKQMDAAQKVFGKDLDAACEALSLEKSWRDIPVDLPDTHPFSGL